MGRFHEISPRYHTREGAEKSREKRHRAQEFGNKAAGSMGACGFDRS
ncbi:hypothetical protein GGP80_003259, partial [Salinibacter ruber]|nr:hypothetical protein [Salinibacter ruber]